ncbi:GNAT family N-acetyltransferase [Paenibacillus sp. HJGM_3]|uniref:GNAT family N-acetyltransferase n=1 Tax=Paenibacillus sp. HJGM_3 TaxID=3379816 RepID=UPI00385921A5
MEDLTSEKRVKPLFLVVPKKGLESLSKIPQLNEEYLLRTYEPGDETVLAKLLASEGWGYDDVQISGFLDHVLPEGLFFVVHKPTGTVVSTASALHHPASPHWHFRFGGAIGYVITLPEHRGKGIGYTVSAAAARRLIRAGYTNIRVGTNDNRLAALRIYLKLGFVPFLYSEDSESRWSAVCEKLSWPFTPYTWIRPGEEAFP